MKECLIKTVENKIKKKEEEDDCVQISHRQTDTPAGKLLLEQTRRTASLLAQGSCTTCNAQVVFPDFCRLHPHPKPERCTDGRQLEIGIACQYFVSLVSS